MSEMVEMKSGAIADQSTIFTDFHISEYIYIRLVCISFLFVPFQESNDLRSYNDLNRSKLLLSTAILAMRTQECPIPIFVEVVNRLLLLPFQGVPSSSPLLGSYFPHYGERGCSTTFSSSFYRRCPDFCADIPSLVSWFSCQTNTPKDKVIVSRSYDWIVTYSSHASWRFNQMDKEIQQRQLPVLFMLQGFSSVALWGPSVCPLAALSLFWVKSSYTDIKKLPLSCMYQSMLKCWYEAASAGTRQMLFSMGQKYYTQLLSEEARMQRLNAEGMRYVDSGTTMFSNMMELLTGVSAIYL